MVKLSAAFLLLCTQLHVANVSSFAPTNNLEARNGIATSSTTALGFNWFGLGKGGEDVGSGDGDKGIGITNTQQKDYVSTDWLSNNLPAFGSKGSQVENVESADIVIVGGGISGLAAAITARRPWIVLWCTVTVRLRVRSFPACSDAKGQASVS